MSRSGEIDSTMESIHPVLEGSSASGAVLPLVGTNPVNAANIDCSSLRRHSRDGEQQLSEADIPRCSDFVTIYTFGLTSGFGEYKMPEVLFLWRFPKERRSSGA
jgi:hypothetical protein